MNICLTANTDWYLWNFRRELAQALRAQGHSVCMVCPPGEYARRLEADGFTVRTFTAPVHGFSLIGNLRALREITAAYAGLEPDLVHLFTPACVLLGSIAARRCGITRVVAALTGLGHVFTSNSLNALALRPLLRRLFRRQLSSPGTAVIFQNQHDLDELVAAGVVDAGRCHLVRGSGVDPERFRPRELPRDDDEIRILFASRLLREKGIDELLQAFGELRGDFPQARLWIAGSAYAPNPTSLSETDIAMLGERPGVRCLGQVEDVAALLREVDVVALPSYREGTPKILLEAAAAGLPIVATDIPGCHGVVVHGANGLLVPVRSVAALAKALTRLCDDPELRLRMGRRGRDIAVSQFSSERVIRETLAVYAKLADSPA